MADDTPWFSPEHQVGIPRRRTPGEEVWRLEHDGRTQSCELRDDSTVGAGWDVMILEAGEPRFSRRCMDERGARYLADCFRQDLVLTGWIDDRDPNR